VRRFANYVSEDTIYDGEIAQYYEGTSFWRTHVFKLTPLIERYRLLFMDRLLACIKYLLRLVYRGAKLQKILKAAMRELEAFIVRVHSNRIVALMLIAHLAQQKKFTHLRKRFGLVRLSVLGAQPVDDIKTTQCLSLFKNPEYMNLRAYWALSPKERFAQRNAGRYLHYRLIRTRWLSYQARKRVLGRYWTESPSLVASPRLFFRREQIKTWLRYKKGPLPMTRYYFMNFVLSKSNLFVSITDRAGHTLMVKTPAQYGILGRQRRVVEVGRLIIRDVLTQFWRRARSEVGTQLELSREQARQKATSGGDGAGGQQLGIGKDGSFRKLRIRLILRFRGGFAFKYRSFRRAVRRVIRRKRSKYLTLRVSHVIMTSHHPHGGCRLKIRKRKKNKGRNRFTKRARLDDQKRVPRLKAKLRARAKRFLKARRKVLAKRYGFLESYNQYLYARACRVLAILRASNNRIPLLSILGILSKRSRAFTMYRRCRVKIYKFVMRKRRWAKQLYLYWKKFGYRGYRKKNKIFALRNFYRRRSKRLRLRYYYLRRQYKFILARWHEICWRRMRLKLAIRRHLVVNKDTRKLYRKLLLTQPHSLGQAIRRWGRHGVRYDRFFYYSRRLSYDALRRRRTKKQYSWTPRLDSRFYLRWRRKKTILQKVLRRKYKDIRLRANRWQPTASALGREIRGTIANKNLPKAFNKKQRNFSRSKTAPYSASIDGGKKPPL
jgi:hypothetical protein